MKTKILLLDVREVDSRKVCEYIENSTFNNKDEIRDKLKELGFDGYPLIMELTIFMDECNNGAEWLEEYFISYVHIKTDN